MQEFKSDYDKENDDLFLYNPKSKSRASIEIGDIILDFDKNKTLSAIEIMNATKFIKSFLIDDKITIDKESLANLITCRVDTKVQDNLLLVKIVLLMKFNKQIPLVLSIPRITRSSPALSAA